MQSQQRAATGGRFLRPNNAQIHQLAGQFGSRRSLSAAWHTRPLPAACATVIESDADACLFVLIPQSRPP